jgi:hypothetical protein
VVALLRVLLVMVELVAKVVVAVVDLMVALLELVAQVD